MQNNSNENIEDMPSAPLYNEEDVLKSMDIANLNEIYYRKEKTICDILLAIIDICAGKRKNYYCVLSPTTNAYWQKIMKNNLFKIIFAGYRPETLRKYWRCIRRSKNIVMFVNILKGNASIINASNKNIFSIIKIIDLFIEAGNKDDFHDFLKENIKGKRRKHRKFHNGKKDIKLIH